MSWSSRGSFENISEATARPTHIDVLFLRYGLDIMFIVADAAFHTTRLLVRIHGFTRGARVYAFLVDSKSRQQDACRITKSRKDAGDFWSRCTNCNVVCRMLGS
jgi:hypothetical protein